MKTKFYIMLMLVVMCFYLSACHTPYIKSMHETGSKPILVE